MSEANELASVLVDQVRVRLNRIVELRSEFSPNALNALKALDAIALPNNDETPALAQPLPKKK